MSVSMYFSWTFMKKKEKREHKIEDVFFDNDKIQKKKKVYILYFFMIL
tara:strand:+ start:485 stop:628 length:144 start_codon:yes stop_codon:yes gene_type:complete